jgi:hypothetical protein
MTADEWDDSDWDEWMAMTDAKRDALLEGAWRDYQAMVNAMSRDEFYRYRRKKRVAGCLRWRKLIREHGMDFMRENLRRAQRMLVTLRIERRTGIPCVPADLQ